MAGVREGTKSGKVTISQRNRTPSPRRVSDGFVRWGWAVRHRLGNYNIGRLGREEDRFKTILLHKMI